MLQSLALRKKTRNMAYVFKPESVAFD